MIRRIILSPLAIIRFILLIATMMLWLTWYSIFKKNTKENAFKLRRHWLKNVALPVMNLDIKVEGSPSKSAALYVANHRSFTDPVIICTYLDAFVIAKAEVAKYPIINKGAEMTGVIWVKRSEKTSRTAVREMMIETLLKGDNVLVFPEGTVGTQSNILPLKPGSFIEAHHHKIPIVPIACEYRDEKDMWTSNLGLLGIYFNQFSAWKTEVKLSFGDVLDGEDGLQKMDACQQWIDRKLNEMHHNWSRINFDKING